MTHNYHETAKMLRLSGVDNEYVAGWCSGALGNPEREEQTTTERFQAGYADGQAGTTDQAQSQAA